MAEVQKCSPTCQSFKCAKNATVYRREDVWCRWTEDTCNVTDCTYAMCIKRRMLPGGVCGETIKRKTVEKPPDAVIAPAVKLRGKTLRKIGDREIF